jgi:Wzt C-terminal domain
VKESGSGRCFLRWEIAGQGHTLRENFSEVTLRVQVNLAEPIVQGHFGLAIQNESNLTMVGWGFDDLNVPSGPHELTLRVPQLPLRPGVYTVLCSLFNRGNNLTGGQPMDHWYATPPLVVDTVPLTHPQDHWAGVLNIPADFQAAQLATADWRIPDE